MNQPTIVATGMACLDVMGIDTTAKPSLSAGGFPNILIILKTKGWHAIPVADLGCDRAGDYIARECAEWNLDNRFLHHRSDILTPIYVLNYQEDHHTFEKICPYCARPFPPYTPVHPQRIDTLIATLPNPVEVFYFDKVSLSAIRLAQHYKQSSACIFFEPNRIDDPELFRQSVELADIVKYSQERREGVHAFTDRMDIPLEIETLGKEGLRYRMTEPKKRSSWKPLPAVEIHQMADAAGAGDWVTATLIDQMTVHHAWQSLLSQKKLLEDILIQGQNASAQNCYFMGARGILYQDRTMMRGNDFCPHCPPAATGDKVQRGKNVLGEH